MKKYLFWVGILLIIVVFVSGCGMKRPYMTNQPAALKPSEGKALVNFMRPSGYARAASFSIWDGDKLIGMSFGKESFQYECDPGKHLFITWSEYKSPLEADLLPNRVYYVLLRIRMGMWRGRLHFIPINKEHELWNETLSSYSLLPNYAFDRQYLVDLENKNKQKILDYLNSYDNEVKGTKHVNYLRPEDGVNLE